MKELLSNSIVVAITYVFKFKSPQSKEIKSMTDDLKEYVHLLLFLTSGHFLALLIQPLNNLSHPSPAP